MEDRTGEAVCEKLWFHRMRCRNLLTCTDHGTDSTALCTTAAPGPKVSNVRATRPLAPLAGLDLVLGTRVQHPRFSPRVPRCAKDVVPRAGVKDHFEGVRG